MQSGFGSSVCGVGTTGTWQVEVFGNAPNPGQDNTHKKPTLPPQVGVGLGLVLHPRIWGTQGWRAPSQLHVTYIWWANLAPAEAGESWSDQEAASMAASVQMWLFAKQVSTASGMWLPPKLAFLCWWGNSLRSMSLSPHTLYVPRDPGDGTSQRTSPCSTTLMTSCYLGDTQ